MHPAVDSVSRIPFRLKSFLQNRIQIISEPPTAVADHPSQTGLR